MADTNTTEVLQKLITRDQLMAFMECKKDGKLHLIGEGFTDLSESKGAKEYSRKYIHNKTEISDTIGFAPSLSYSCDVISGDPVVEEIVEITDYEKIGTDAHRDIVVVNGWTPGTTSGTFAAFKRKFSVVPDGKGSGTEALVYTGTFKARGDLIPGSLDAATNTFTPDTAKTE